VARNVFPEEPGASGAAPLAAHVLAQKGHLAGQETTAIAGGQVNFKEPVP
jgi:hypothetical protein